VGCSFTRSSKRARSLRAYRDYVDEGPDELATAFAFFPAPPEPFIPEQLQGRTVLGIIACHCGNLEEGEPGERLPLQPQHPAGGSGAGCLRGPPVAGRRVGGSLGTVEMIDKEQRTAAA
jgi:hypothetical protein